MIIFYEYMYYAQCVQYLNKCVQEYAVTGKYGC